MAVAGGRSVDLYHDPALDGLIGQGNSIFRNSSHKRGAGTDRLSLSDHSNSSTNPPPVPEVPRAPPMSYRNGTREANGIQRSFSQRAKGRPFAREALEDDDEAYNEYEPVQQARAVHQVESPGSARARGDGPPLHLDTTIMRENAVSQSWAEQAPTVRVPSATRGSAMEVQQTRRASAGLRTAPEQREPPVRSDTLPSAEEQQRDWAPDRSPLQKLEVTLNDISKEEKRARVEEAEMLLRDAKAGRGSRRVSREVSSSARAPVAISERQASKRVAAPVSEPQNLEEAGLVRNLSTTQRDRLQHSTTIDSRKPDVRRLSGEGRRGFEYEEQSFNTTPSRPRGVPPKAGAQHGDVKETDRLDRSSRAHGGRVPSLRREPEIESLPAAAERFDREHPSQTSRNQLGASSNTTRRLDRRAQTSQKPDDPREAEATDESLSLRQSSVPQPVAHSVPTNITRAVSMQHRMPEAQFPDDPDISRPTTYPKGFNSSHKAALSALEGTGVAVAASAPQRSSSRKLQKAPPPIYDQVTMPSRGGDTSKSINMPPAIQAPTATRRVEDEIVEGPRVETYQKALPREVDVQRVASRRQPGLDSMGVQDDTLEESPKHNQKGMSSPASKPRHASVTFSEPAGRESATDEWRDGGVARLSLADMSLDEPNRPARNKAWWEENAAAGRRTKSKRSSAGSTSTREIAGFDGPIDDRHARFNPPLYLKCGPLLRYTGMKHTSRPGDGNAGSAVGDSEIWRGSVMIVTQDSSSSYEEAPVLRLFSQPKTLLPPPPQEVEGGELAPEYVDPVAGLTKVSRNGAALYVRPVDHLEEEKDLSRIENDDGLFEASPSPLDVNGSQGATVAATNRRTTEMDGEHVGKVQEVRGARLYTSARRDVTFWRFNIEVELGETEQHIAYRINRGAAVGFWVPGRGQSMNIMFHSGNGFGLSVDPDHFSGPDPLWRDVLNTHQTRPFHVMVGGGDQIYHDHIAQETQHFGDWAEMRNAQQKYQAPFSPEMKDELEAFYLNRYAAWFSQGLFAMAASSIPMVNVWDDHDIIGGYGSYPDHVMRSPVFSGLGGVAHKYYLLFQHQSVPEETAVDEPSWLLGAKPGPYIRQLSRSVFMSMGQHVAFLGLDCRTERTRDEILSVDTYDKVLERCRRELVEGETKHLIVLLAVPIAYPRLVWLENVLGSRAMNPVKALGRMGVLKGTFLNNFDGGVEILDDLDDHWTSRNHKDERNDFVKDLQDLAAEKSVRITILGGDVHMAAVGQFYSVHQLRIPKDRDHRYICNVISSAIVNPPPPEMIGDILNKRNKVHHLDEYTDEDMIPMFTHDVDNKKRNNKRLLPRRNWCSIREYQPGATPPPTPPASTYTSEHEFETGQGRMPPRRFSFSREDANPRNLFRRLSSRNAPPTSYRETMDYGNAGQQRRAASFDGTRPGQAQQGHHTQQPLPANPSPSSMGSGQPGQRRASFDHASSGAPARPGFHRRPTNLSERAARKGNEFEGEDVVNLEGGLDVILNCEINPRDPAGITTPYRLLIPALWYDGSSDREKLDAPQAHVATVQRRPTLLGRMRLSSKRDNRVASNQGAGNWGNDGSETESYSGSDDMEDAAPRRRFSFLGSLRRRREKEDYDYDEEEDKFHTHNPGTLQQAPVVQPGHQGANGRQHGQDTLDVGRQRPATDHINRHPAEHHEPASRPEQRTSSGRQTYVVGSQPQPPPYNPPPLTDRSTNPRTPPEPQPRPSKQDRVLGIASTRDRYQQPEQHHLRGNGIIGRNYDPNPPSAYPTQSYSQPQSPNVARGYSGIDAYQEPKARRRWSLRGAGRRLIGDGSVQY